ncbi:MAG: hypothetical protein ACREQ5_33870 [Candidatus Dormibacteria bacterium]
MSQPAIKAFVVRRVTYRPAGQQWGVFSVHTDDSTKLLAAGPTEEWALARRDEASVMYDVREEGQA